MDTPKSQRLTLTLVGKTNVGKSTLLNLIAGQNVAITSPIAGTTTDVVEKAMEFLPFGPVLWLDTGGWDDTTALGQARKERTRLAIHRADILLGVVTAENSTLDPELIACFQATDKPKLLIVTQVKAFPPGDDFLQATQAIATTLCVDAADGANRDIFLRQFRTALAAILPPEFIQPPSLLGGIVPQGGTVLQIVPIDSQAPKGRLILPQVNLLRNALDQDYISVVITANRITETLAKLKTPPDLAICDSQVVDKMIAALPPSVPCTTYSILMARMKGDLPALVEGARAIRNLRDGDTILIAEACTHHAAEEDIGRVKIPAWLRKMTGKNLTFQVATGKDFPQDLTKYALIVHCGGCMINRPLMLWRIQQAQQAKIPITNYGVCISETQGVLDRVLSPFFGQA